MLVRILKDIFDNPENNQDLDNILKHFRIGKHKWLLDNLDTIDALYNSDWIKEINSRDRKIIDGYVRASTRQNKNQSLINVSNLNTDINYQIEEADKYLDQPLIILLENSKNDSPFINAILKYFDESGVLLKAKMAQWIKYGMGGGTAIVNVLQSEIENSFNAPYFKKDKKVYLRYFIIIDSDKQFPTMEIEAKKVNEIKGYEVKYHILTKRETENYVPLSVLQKLNDEYLNIYINFKQPEQKDFFDLEKGFNGKNRKNLHAKIQELYPPESVSDSNWNVLRNGIQNNLYSKGKRRFNSPMQLFYLS